MDFVAASDAIIGGGAGDGYLSYSSGASHHHSHLLGGPQASSSASSSYHHPTTTTSGGAGAGAASHLISHHTAGGGGAGGINDGNGPILYTEPNRTSAIDDIRSVVLYIFIITIFLSFFLILPGIRNEKFPTFLCITTSLFVTSIILLSLFGTTWHVGEAPISAAYKAFSRDRIQGELTVRIGLQSVNITLRAQKYYILDATNGPIIMDNVQSSGSMMMPILSSPKEEEEHSTTTTTTATSGRSSSSNLKEDNLSGSSSSSSLTDELISDGSSASSLDTELEVEEVFASVDGDDSSLSSQNHKSRSSRSTKQREANGTLTATAAASKAKIEATSGGRKPKRMAATDDTLKVSNIRVTSTGQKYTIKRVNVDINYNERFYWIGPSQMRREYHNALERGLPYPILTVVEYLSQDDAGFSWSRQYRLAGYYSTICLWLSFGGCVLMFVLHCAAPKYGIYMMQILGGMLLFTNLTYASLVPRGDQKLVIPFEGQSLTFKFGWNFWIVLIGGCVSLIVGSIIVLIDSLYPNYIFTTVLDVDFDHNYYRRQKPNNHYNHRQDSSNNALERPVRPPFYGDTDELDNESTARGTNSSVASSPQINNRAIASSASSVISSSSSSSSQFGAMDERGGGERLRFRQLTSSRQEKVDAFKVTQERKLSPTSSTLSSSPSLMERQDHHQHAADHRKRQDSRASTGGGVFASGRGAANSSESKGVSSSSSSWASGRQYFSKNTSTSANVVRMSTKTTTNNISDDNISDTETKSTTSSRQHKTIDPRHDNLLNHVKSNHQRQQQQHHHYNSGQAAVSKNSKASDHRAQERRPAPAHDVRL